MCQPAPLGRCANHVEKEKQKLNTEAIELSRKKLATSEKVVEAKRAARDAGYSDDEIMESSTPGLEDLNALRRQYDQLDRDSQINVRNEWEQELHSDATLSGRKALEEDTEAAKRGFRMNNARALKDWHKELRATTDSDGTSITSKDSDDEERYAFYGKEFLKARKDYENAVEAGNQNFDRVDKLNDELNTYETTTVGRNDPAGRRAFSRVAVHEKDREDVEYLESQKAASLITMNQTHYDQVLARAKMNRLKVAIKEERKKREAVQKVLDGEAAERLAERRAFVKMRSPEVVSELKSARMQLANMAKAKSSEANHESLRLSAKAEAVNTSAQALERFQNANRGAPENAFIEFRGSIQQKHAEAVKEVEKADNDADRELWTGVQSGYSLVLDKVKNL